MDRIHQPTHGSLHVEGVMSEALRGRGSVWIYLPPEYDTQPDREFPALYLLHGAWGWEFDWAVKGRAGETAGQMIAAGEIEPHVIVMPSDGLTGIGSLYVNWRGEAPQYADWIVHDLTGHIETNLRVMADRRSRCIGGLSMGGYGAVNLGLSNRELYRSVASHSGFFDVRALGEFFQPVYNEALGTPERVRANNPMEYVEDIPADEMPALHFDCGTDDFLYEANVSFHERLEDLGLPHTYREHPGSHTWDYWSEHLADQLLFHFGDR
ncbi:MAG: hypothetical protein GF320_08625 [Armatimonadia bacterium]|nr:hypothetical protein [Armatimonadia bacterium]